MPPLIEVRDLRFRYEDGTPALNGVDFQPAARVKPWRYSAPTAAVRRLSSLHLNGLLTGEGR